MRLSDLAQVFHGYEWKGALLSQGGPNDIAYMAQPIGAYRYIPYKEARRQMVSKLHYLQYGDYLLSQGDDGPKLHRFDEIGAKPTLASHEFFVIRPEIAILSEFFAHEKNKRYFLGRNLSTLDNIQNIEIFTDNIRELEEVETAEEMGIHAPVDFNEVQIAQKPLPMDKLIKRIDHRELLLETDFQRRPDLWDLTTKSRFIESMLVRLPVPAFYFDGSDDNQWLVIDGLQRLSTVHAYLGGKFGLQDLVFLPNSFIGKTFDQLERPYQRNIEEYEIFAYIIQKAPPPVKYKLFRNINTGALRLEPQEIRHTVNPGKPAQFIKNIAGTDWFRTYVPMGERLRDRMNDREMVLRFITFRRLDTHNYKPSNGVVELLDKAMTNLYEIPEFKLKEYENELKNALETIYKVFGEEPFSRTLFDADQQVVAHNNLLFELLTHAFARLSEARKVELVARKDEVAERIKDYFREKTKTIPRFWESSYAYSTEGIRRFDELTKFLTTL